MLKMLLLFLCCIPFFAKAQTDLLILKRRGMQIYTYTTGDQLVMETVYHQWFEGTIAGLRHDSLFLRGIGFHYKEIASVQRYREGSGLSMFGTGMMIAGGGIFVLGAVNGAYRGDKTKDWYTGSGLVTGAALIAGGYFMRKSYTKKYHLGRKYQLEYLTLNPNK